ncbi:hypothetical protein HDU98_005448, partial [Podochytrium sp. JEL0797]
AGEVETAVLVLLDVKDDSLVNDFFESLKPTRTNDLLAMYFYSIRSLMYLVPPAHRAVFTEKLLDVAPMDLLKYMDSTFIRDTLAKCDETCTSVQSLHAAIRFSSRTKASQNDKIVQQILDVTGSNEELFSSDVEYRKQVVLEVAKRANEDGLLNNVLAVAEGLGASSASVLALEHLCWLFLDRGVSTEVVRQGLTEFGGVVGEEEVVGLCAIKEEVEKSGDEPKMALYYSYLAHRFAGNETVAFQLNARNALIQALATSRSRIFDGVHVDSVITHNYAASDETLVQFYAGLLAKNPCVSALVELVHLVTRLRELKYLDLFPDEKKLLASYGQWNAFDNKKLFAMLTEPLVEAKLAEVDFEYAEEEMIEMDFKEMTTLVTYASLEKVQSVKESYLVGEESIFVPIEYRIRLAVKCLDRLQQSGAETKNLHEVVKHLQMIEGMSELVDNASGETMPLERVQQFDSAFAEGVEENIILCMKMVIAGTSPHLASQACILLSDRFGATSDDFNVQRVYTDSVLSVIGVPRLSGHARAVRRDVERPVDALDRLFAAVVANLGTVGSGEEVVQMEEVDGWDLEDGFGEERVEEGVEGVVVRVRDVTVDVIEERRDVIDADMRLSLMGLLKKYFKYEEIAEDQIQLAKLESVARNVWDLEIDESETKDVTLFTRLFHKLLALSTSVAHCEGLVLLVESLSPDFLPQDVLRRFKHDMVLKSAETQSFELLMRLRFRDDSGFDDVSLSSLVLCGSTILLTLYQQNTESEVVAMLKSQSGNASVIEWVKHSLLSTNEAVASACHPVLMQLANEASSNSLVQTDVTLHFAVLANSLSCELAGTPLWPWIVATLATRQQGSSAFLTTYESLVNSTVLDLVIGRAYLDAFGVVVRVFGISTRLLGSQGAVRAVLKGYLRRVCGGDDVAVVLRDEEDAGDVGIGRGVVLRLDEVMEMRAKGGLEGSKVLIALASLEAKQ